MMETVPGFNPVCALEKRNQKPLKSAIRGIIGLIGHPYLVYDQYINMNICNKLRARGYDLLFPENIPLNEVDRECERYPKKLFWSYGKRLCWAAVCMLEHKRVVGLILVTSFGCGIDSFHG
jgi:predicted nucleotide-binding protein (sugar kinase/HSP70/actin superfamily)